ncbi:hypothetical protein H920_15296 [Fukomys damarensis]|uniref:Uncharacterized protein n=1 Tax=Fukomys damarensis TaxID=885580 RepID=A0A091CZN2_FUKDA|nr:hypothetical protein H920_15296 [Fukomys damarensis]
MRSVPGDRDEHGPSATHCYHSTSTSCSTLLLESITSAKKTRGEIALGLERTVTRHGNSVITDDQQEVHCACHMG